MLCFSTLHKEASQLCGLDYFCFFLPLFHLFLSFLKRDFISSDGLFRLKCLSTILFSSYSYSPGLESFSLVICLMKMNKPANMIIGTSIAVIPVTSDLTLWSLMQALTKIYRNPTKAGTIKKRMVHLNGFVLAGISHLFLSF